ncbi:Flp pilus assembly protein TadG [Bauldia litoralis]|uniref:Flp pilus assembly protein TadG n=1 Tax=Bauldia litoralis TaxID=665467 RepID=A0A1G6C4X4_9HYPH|nr:Flp pilus assembly protein TadG [Bauldia litoralis]
MVMIKKFLKRIHGNVTMTFAIAAVPVIAAAGAAIDYSNAEEQRTVTQAALDRASLAVLPAIGTVPPEAVVAEAQALYTKGVEGRLSVPPPVVVDLDGGNLSLRSELQVPTRFLRLVGVDHFAFDLSAEAVAANVTYEVALVLDTSGSMAGSKIRSLKQAAGDLTRSLFTANRLNPWPEPVKVSVVPFAAAVNVGPQNASAAWIDGKAQAPAHLENFEPGASSATGNRLALFEALPGVTWAGCVEARPHPFDVSDTAPTADDPATLFVPMFAPDEPDLNGFDNNYLADSSPACTGPDAAETRVSTAQAAQQRLCKYRDSAPLGDGNSNGTVIGPNVGCTSAPVLPLTDSQDGILATIDNLNARGMTDLHEGVMWGWRALSSAMPFAEGRPSDDRNNRKIMIVMSDGENSYDTYDNFNKSAYGAHGYVARGHLGTTSSDRATVLGKLNERTMEACTNARAEGGVQIYTIAFQITDPATRDLLKACADTPAMAFDVDSNTGLVAAFRDIATDVAMIQ